MLQVRCYSQKEFNLLTKRLASELKAGTCVLRYGGPGSGNFGHEGRPGEVGGSGSSKTPGKGGNRTSIRKKPKMEFHFYTDAASGTIEGASLADALDTLVADEGLDEAAAKDGAFAVVEDERTGERVFWHPENEF